MFHKCFSLLLILMLLLSLAGCAEKTPTAAVIEASELQNYAVDSDGALWFWGTTISRATQAITDITDYLSPTPQKVMDDVKDIKTGELFTLILKADGSLWGWGTYQDTMELMDPPEKLMDNVVQISAEGVSLYALDAEGVLWDWGRASKLPLSDAGDNVYELSRPTQVMEGVRQVSATDTGALCVCKDGSLWQLSRLVENKQRADNVSNVIASTRLSATIDDDGTLWTWDANWELSEVADHVVMAAVELMDIEMENTTVMYVTDDHTLWLKGYDIRTGNYEERPIIVMDDVAEVSLSSSHVLVLTTDGNVFGWGDNTAAALANAEEEFSAEPVAIALN